MHEEQARKLLDSAGGITDRAGFKRLIEARLIVLDGWEPNTPDLADKVDEVDANMHDGH